MLLASVGGLNMGDMIIQLIFFLFVIAFIVGVVSLIVMFSRRNKSMNRIEEKIDKLLSEKEK